MDIVDDPRNKQGQGKCSEALNISPGWLVHAAFHELEAYTLTHVCLSDQAIRIRCKDSGTRFRGRVRLLNEDDEPKQSSICSSLT